MKVRTSFLTRCLAFALAVMLLLSGTNMGVALQVLAASDAVSDSFGEIVAKNYDLSGAEKALLESGYLAGGNYSYSIPDTTDNLVSVDTDTKTITAIAHENWVATEAQIVVGTEVKETVSLTNGKGSYQYAGNAFSVKAVYVLNTDVDPTVQETLLNTGAWLKQGVANTDAVAAQSGNLFIVEQAMPQLVNLADNGIPITVAGNPTYATINDPEVKAAIYALNDQMTAHNGVLTLSAMVTEYEASAKTAYVLTKATDMLSEVNSLINYVDKIAVFLESMATAYGNLGMIDETTKNQLNTLTKSLNTLKDELDKVNDDSWTAANKGTALVSDSVNYAVLDKLVAALGNPTSVTVKNPLKVEQTTLQVNMAMFNVTVKVVLNTVNEENVVAEYGSKEAVLTLGEGAMKAEIEAAVAENGIKTDALTEWSDVYVAEHFNEKVTALPDELSDDIEYVITYAPKNYTVTIADESAEYPYGYKLTLPEHEDASKSYDYEDADGKYYAQGSEIIVAGSMTFTREEGKAYTRGQLLEIIAENYAAENAKVAAILNSGALNVDEVISYREPTKGELEELVKLEDSTLTVKPYESSYANLNWEPYSYVVDGTEKLFGGATEVTISGDFTTVNVYYRLTMSNHTKADVGEIFALVATLAEEADGQKTVMDKLASYEGQMGQLTKNMLTGLNAVIGNYSTANGGGLNNDPTTNDELVAYFQETIAKIMDECTEGQALKLYNIILAYNDENSGGLYYYYQNHETIRNEVAVLSGYLNDMLDGGDRQAALEKLMAENGYADKVDLLETLGDKLAEISADLKPVNDAIDTSDDLKLSAISNALAMEGDAKVTEYDSPYRQMGPITRTATKYATVEVKVTAGTKKNTDPITVTVMKGEALSQAQVDELKAKVNTFVDNSIETVYYSNNFNNGAELDALVGVALDKSATYEYTWTPRNYTVKIGGEADQSVNINKLVIELPAHPNAATGYSYEYTIGNKTAKAGPFTFAKEDLNTLFVGGTLTITRVEKSQTVEDLVKMVNTINTQMGFEALTLVEENGVYTGINANIAMSDMMDFVMGLVLKSGYGYIGLNNEGLVYSNDKAEMELSIQTLINAILADEEFNNSVLLALAENGKGKVMTASMQLGNSASELSYTDLEFTLNLTSVPEQLTSNANYIKTVSNYLTFESNNGVLDVTVNLPDQVYAAYAAALIATGYVEKTDVNALEQAVAMQFLCDYITAITGSEMDMETYTNTMNMLGIGKDLTGYNKAYEFAKDSITITVPEDYAELAISAEGNTAIDALIKIAGINTDSVSSYLTMIKEYKAGNTIDVKANATLANVDKTYYALIADVQADGVTNKVAAPSSKDALAKKTAALAGYSAVMLLDNVDCDLTFGGTTILDLNGKNIEGNVKSTGTLYIIDSSMDTYNAGTVTGAVSGNVTIIGGNYKTDVSSFLKDGYYMDGTTVRNALYYITASNDTVNFVLNADVYNDENVNGYIPNVQALAVDIAGDLVLNYALSAKLAVEDNELININIEDLVNLYAGDNRAEKLIKSLVDCVTVGEEGYENNVGFEAVVNLIIEDLIDFGTISDALTNNTPLVSYKLTTAPWIIDIDEEKTDYVHVNVGSNEAKERSVTIALTVESEDNKYVDKLAALAGELANIVEVGENKTNIVVDIPQPTYSGKKLTVSGAGKAEVYVDMSGNSDYATMIGVIVAYGNSAKRAAVAEAVNAGDMDALKAVIDGTYVKELFTALKAMSRAVDFAEMAKTVGVTTDVTSVAALEDLYHLPLCAAGKALEKLEITGKDSKLGGLYNAGTGYYELSKEDIFRDAEISRGGYTALVELEATVLSLNVKLFAKSQQPSEPDECMWGDADHDLDVDGDDASLILQYELGIAPGDFCTLRTDVDGSGTIDGDDASLVLQYELGVITEFPAEKN